MTDSIKKECFLVAFTTICLQKISEINFIKLIFNVNQEFCMQN